MKRFKVLLIALICSFLCFSLAGCAQNGECLPNSLDSRISVYDFSESISVSYSFGVTVPSTVSYEVKYNLTIYNGDQPIITDNITKTISPSEDGTRTVQDYRDYDYNTTGISESNLRLSITDVTVTPKESDDEYQSYAIGFGTVGGAVLIAITVLFIVLKKKENNPAE